MKIWCFWLTACMVHVTASAQSILLPIYQDGLYGYINFQGKVVVKPSLDEATLFGQDSLGVVVRNDSVGIIDTTGHIIWHPQADEITILNPHITAIRFSANQWKICSFDSTNFNSSPEDEVFSLVERFSNELAFVYRGNTTGLYSSTKRVMLLKPVFDSIRILGPAYFGYKGDSVQIFDTSGQYSNHFPKAEHFHLNWWPIIGLGMTSEQIRLVHLETNTTSPLFSSPIQRKNDSLFICNSDSGFQLYNVHSNHSIPIKASWKVYPYQQHYLIQKGTQYALLDANGKELLASNYQQIRVNGEWLLTLNQDGWGLHDAEGKSILPNQYNIIYEADDQTFHLVKNGLHGISKKNGVEVIPCRYDKIRALPNLIKASRNDTVTFFELDDYGNILQSFRFNNIILADADGDGKRKNLIESRDTVEAGKWSATPVLQKWGYSTKKGKIKVPYIYNNVEEVPNSPYVIVTKSRNKPLPERRLLDGYYSIKQRKGLFDDVGQRYSKPRKWQIFSHELSLKDVHYARILTTSGKFTLNASKRIPNSRKEYTYIGPNQWGYSLYNDGGEYYISTNPTNPENICSRSEFQMQIGELSTDEYYPEQLNREYVAIKGGSWGYLNTWGEETHAKFDFARPFSYGQAMVKMGNGWGLMMPSNYFFRGDAKYMAISLQQVGKSHLYKVKNSETIQGFISPNGKYPFDPIMIESSPFRNGFALARENKSWYFINTKGEKLPHHYSMAKSFSHGLALVKFNRNTYFIDTTGKTVITGDFHTARSFTHPSVTWVKQGKNWRLINRSGDFLTRYKITRVEPFHGDISAVRNGNKKYRLIHSNGKYLNRYRFRNIPKYSGSLLVGKKREKYILLNPMGELITKKHFNRAYKIADGKAIARQKKVWYLIDSSGNLQKLPYDFQRTDTLSENACAVRIKGKWGYINGNGQLIIEPSFSMAKAFKHGVAEVAFNDERRAYINRKGDTLFTFRGQAKYLPQTNYLILEKDGKTGFYDHSGNLLFSRTFRDAKPFSKGYAPVKIGNYWTLLDSTGHIKLTAIYKEIFEESENYFRFERDGREGGIVKGNETLIPTVYDEVTLVYDGIIQAKLGNKINYFVLGKGWIWNDPSNFSDDTVSHPTPEK